MIIMLRNYFKENFSRLFQQCSQYMFKDYTRAVSAVLENTDGRDQLISICDSLCAGDSEEKSKVTILFRRK